MPPPSPWLPRSEPVDDRRGTREAPHGYRPWPNSVAEDRADSSRPILRRPRPAAALVAKIRSRRAVVGVIGLGYVGLPLVRLFLSKGFRVLGFDVDPRKVRSLNAGESYIDSVPSELVRKYRRARKFEATSDFRKLRVPDAIIICVPTPLTGDGRPDLSYIEKTAASIRPRLRAGQLVVLESTTYPGTTREIMLPELAKSGLRCGRDYFLAFSPEREDPGNKTFTNASIPKIVGGLDADSLRAASALYGSAVEKVVEVSSPEVAESAKLLENIYRCVNIALVNELKMCFDRMGIDVWETIAAASTKPFGFQAFYPGPGLGGHCIPIDPFYLSWKAREHGFVTRFIELAGVLNVRMPYYVVERLEEVLKSRRRRLKGARVLILGLAYKKDIDDPRESPAFKIAQILQRKGAVLSWADPHFEEIPEMRHYPGLRMRKVEPTAGEVGSHDAVVIVTDHSAFDYEEIARHARLVIDTRNACRNVAVGRENVFRA